MKYMHIIKIHIEICEGRHKIIGSLLIFIPQYLFPDFHC